MLTSPSVFHIAPMLAPPELGAPPAHPQGAPSAGRGPGQEAVLPASCPNRRRHELPPRFSAPTGFLAPFPSWFPRGHCQALRTRPRARASGGIHRDDPLPLCPARGPQIDPCKPYLRDGNSSTSNLLGFQKEGKVIIYGVRTSWAPWRGPYASSP